ncbi:MAG: hypothetical protein QXW70_02635 [Candidatus Anstonellales archaeon]
MYNHNIARTYFVFLLLFTYSSCIFSGKFSEELLAKYMGNGEANSSTLAYINSKATLIPSSISSFIHDGERLNLIAKTTEGKEIYVKALVKKSGNTLQLVYLSLGSHNNPTVTLTISESVAERIYKSKDEQKALADALAKGEIALQFHQDIVRQFIWFLAKTVSWVTNTLSSS